MWQTFEIVVVVMESNNNKTSLKCHMDCTICVLYCYIVEPHTNFLTDPDFIFEEKCRSARTGSVDTEEKEKETVYISERNCVECRFQANLPVAAHIQLAQTLVADNKCKL